VIDSKATSGTEILIVDKLVNLIKAGKSFEEIIEAIENYRDKRSLFFSLQKFDNLVNTGRMSKIAGLVAKTLVIRPICIALEGEIKVERKVIGIKNAFKKIVQMIKEKAGVDAPNQKLIITHCKAIDEAEQIKSDIQKECEFKEIEIMPMKGLCSYYALEKGIIICH
jgi:DegV family protein with EDD domain